MTNKSRLLFLQIRAFGEKSPSVLWIRLFTDKGLTDVMHPSRWNLYTR